MTEGSQFRAALLVELVRTAPFLRRAIQDGGGMFGGAPRNPSTFPDQHTDPTYYYSDPPPSGVRAALLTKIVPRFEGFSRGRPWSVEVGVPDILYPGIGAQPSVCALMIKTYVRAMAPGTEGTGPTPWLVFGSVPEPGPPTVRYPVPHYGPVGEAARHGIEGLVARTGRAPIPRLYSPVPRPLVVDGMPLDAVGQLGAPELLEPFARWEGRCGYPAPGGSVRPFLRFTAYRLEFTVGLDPKVPAAVHAGTVVELTEWVSRMERAFCPLDVDATPIPFLTLNGPPGTLPIIRPQFPCPRCGELQLARIVTTPSPKVGRFVCARCGADIFPPVNG